MATWARPERLVMPAVSGQEPAETVFKNGGRSMVQNSATTQTPRKTRKGTRNRSFKRFLSSFSSVARLAKAVESGVSGAAQVRCAFNCMLQD